MTLKDVILRHGGEALQARNNFANSSLATQLNIMFFLNTLVIFPPDDTASNLPGGGPSRLQGIRSSDTVA